MNEIATQRFWANVQRTADCWLWTGGCNHYGYGRFECLNRYYAVHRYSFELHKGAIPEGIQVLHTCDVRHCVNPDHLFLGTNRQNTEDRFQKGRSAHGEGHGRAKLTEQDVRDIREIASKESVSALARRYKVTRSTISRVIDHSRWSHVV